MTVYAPDSQVKSADLNQWQTELFGTHEVWVPASRGMFFCDPTDPITDASAYFGRPGWASAWGSLAGGGFYDVLFGFEKMRVGDQLLSVTVHGRAGNAAGEVLQAQLQYISSAGVVTAFGGADKVSGQANGNTSIGWTVADTDFTPDGFTFLTGRGHQLDVIVPPTSADGEVRIYGVAYTFNRPNPVP